MKLTTLVVARAITNRAGLSAAVLILCIPLMAVTSLAGKSATYDEGAHLVAGYSYLKTGDYRMMPEHPPLMEMVSAFPLVLFTDARLETGSSGWGKQQDGRLGFDFLYTWNEPHRLLFLARLPMVIVSMLLAGAVFLWSRRLFGNGGALVSLALYVFDPNLLAHGRLVTTDLGATAGFLCTAWVASLLVRRVTVLRGGALGLAVGCTAVAKLSGVLVVPILLILGWIRIAQREPWPWQVGGRSGAASRIRGKAVLVLGIALLVLLVGWVEIWAAYRFRYEASPGEHGPSPWRWERFLNDRPRMRDFLFAVRDSRVLPEAFVYGSTLLYDHDTKHRKSFAAGQRLDSGWTWYFPYAFLLKTPLPVLALLLWALVRGRGRRAPPLAVEACWAVPVGIYLAVSILSEIIIGHRHILPIYPLLYVSLGRLGAGWELPGSTGRRRALLILLALLALGTVWIHPHYLAYFNRIGGGPENGYRRLVDSNLDWGQDVPGLARELRRRGIERIYLGYFGTSGTRAYGFVPADETEGTPGIRTSRLLEPMSIRDDPEEPLVVFRRPPSGFYAISATTLQEVYLPRGAAGMYAPFRKALEDNGFTMPGGVRITPAGNVGYSILLFRVE